MRFAKKLKLIALSATALNVASAKQGFLKLKEHAHSKV